MSTAAVLGLYVALPLSIFAVLALLVYAPSWVRGPKYRPGLQWWAEPAWIGGGDLDLVASVSPVKEGGGCSARW